MTPLEAPCPSPRTRTLPVLPLPDGVVLPGMVVTIALETDEARAAAEAAGDGGELLLVPRDRRPLRPRRRHRPHRVHRRPARRHRRPSSSGPPAGPASAPAWSAPAPALWVTAEPVADEPPHRRGQRARRRAAGRRLRALFERLGGRRLAEVLRRVDIDDPGAPGRHRRLVARPRRSSARSSCSRPSTSRRASRKVLGWAKEALAELELTEKIRTDVTDGMEKQQREFLLRQQLAAIRKELGEDGDGEAAVDELPRAASTRSRPPACPRTS